MKEKIAEDFRLLQLEICRDLEFLDGTGKFIEDEWEREGGGGGYTRVISGSIIEKGGVNFSAVHGQMNSHIADKLEMSGGNFFATGVSIVLHPRHPFVPIIHMNVRYFESNDDWWFGGGIDLTPHYIFPAMATSFHGKLKETCDNFDHNFYPEFKKWADTYFNIKHRQESRGVGGIFYDRLNEKSGHMKPVLAAFSLAVGRTFVPIYKEQVDYFKDMKYSDAHLDWMRLRRGRYAEFNLVWDRGTKFGLETDGRTESILMSLPPQADWQYAHEPSQGSEEEITLKFLKAQAVDWIGKNY